MSIKPKHEVTLTFRSREHKEYFLGQLSDGWGENVVSLQWPRNVPLYEAPMVRVTPIGDVWEHHKRIRPLLRRWGVKTTPRKAGVE